MGNVEQTQGALSEKLHDGPFLGLVASGSLAIALFAVLLGRLSTVNKKQRWVWPRSHWLSHWNLAVAVLALAVLGVLLRQHRPDLSSEWKRMDNRERLWLKRTFASFTAGALVGATFRFVVGNVVVGTFAAGSAPIVAGIFVGVIVNGIDDDGYVPRHRQMAMMYLLMASIVNRNGTGNSVQPRGMVLFSVLRAHLRRSGSLYLPRS